MGLFSRTLIPTWGRRANKIRIREVIKPGVTWRLVASRQDTSSL